MKMNVAFLLAFVGCTSPEDYDFTVRPIRGGEIPETYRFTPSFHGTDSVAHQKPAAEVTKIYFNTFSPEAILDGILDAFLTASKAWNNHECINRQFFTIAGEKPVGEIDPSTACEQRFDGVLVSYVTKDWPNYPGDEEWKDVLGCALICKATGKTHHVFINAGNAQNRHHFSPPWRHPNSLADEYSLLAVAVHELGHVFTERLSVNKEHITEFGSANVMDGRLQIGKPFTGFTSEDNGWICDQFEQ